jgi:hypothetical protein
MKRPLLAAALCLAACSDGPAPAKVEVVDLQGLDGALRAERGHAVLVNFWALW